MSVWFVLGNDVRVLAADRAAPIAENLALRHQLAVLRHEVVRARLRRWDRFL